METIRLPAGPGPINCWQPGKGNMPIQLVHVSDIHFGSGESHGTVNPDTGLNVRFEDFVSALGKTVDFCLERGVDVFLFSGDAYRNASPEPVYQKMFARELKRLSDAGVRTILLVGNHDQLLKGTGSHSMSVFQSLQVPGVITVDQPALTRIDTAHGAMQLVGLPHVTRHQLVTVEEYSSMPAQMLDRAIVEKVEALLKSYYAELDPEIPAVATAHMTLDRALAGIEQELLVGYTLTFPADIFIDDRLDYVALGHVHKHQCLRQEKPAIVYAGSLERVDFSEQEEDKGFVHVELERRATKWAFHSVSPRPFVTVEVDLTGSRDPSDDLASAIERQAVPGCVLRVRYRIGEDRAGMVDENRLRAAAARALSLRIQPEVIAAGRRARIPDLNEAAAASPLAALEKYLSEAAPERKETLMNRARDLISRLEAQD